MTQVIRQRPRDCFSCRVVSGLGLIGAGCFVAYHGKRAKYRTGAVIYMSFAAALGGLGVARLFNYPPFNETTEKEKVEDL